MTMIAAPINALGLRDGPQWGSFEDLRVKPAENLAKVQPGTVGTLKVKSKSYRILEEHDFKRLEEAQAALEELATIRRQLDVVFGVVDYAHENNRDDRAITLIDTAMEAVRKTVQGFSTRHKSIMDTVNGEAT